MYSFAQLLAAGVQAHRGDCACHQTAGLWAAGQGDDNATWKAERIFNIFHNCVLPLVARLTKRDAIAFYTRGGGMRDLREIETGPTDKRVRRGINGEIS
jgi:hypothetical protein